MVGVDGSESSVGALEWAAAQATLTGASLEVVATWEYPTSVGWAPAWPPDWDPAAEARAGLEKMIVRALGSDPDVKVKLNVLEGNPGQILVKAAEKAALLVVGSRGHGEFAGLLLGSVCEFCASHAQCPVVIYHRKPA